VLAVLVVPTDPQGEQLQRLNTLLAPIFREGDEHSVRDLFASFFDDLELSDVDGAHGGAVARTDFSTWHSDPLGLETVPPGEAVGELEASREGIDARLRVDDPSGLTP
jgi:hypothetical protein